ncbi:Uncharacterised protein [Mycobacterium tuberculosis]|nr:Uncharacterised protein [Mycobacterium tuberculosis]
MNIFEELSWVLLRLEQLTNTASQLLLITSRSWATIMFNCNQLQTVIKNTMRMEM